MLGRAFGCAQQSWAELTRAGVTLVHDLTLDEEPFERAAYMAALHASVGTRIPLDRTRLAALRAIGERGFYPWDVPRDGLLAAIAHLPR